MGIQQRQMWYVRGPVPTTATPKRGWGEVRLGDHISVLPLSPLRTDNEGQGRINSQPLRVL